MIAELVHDPLFLAKKSEEAGREDIQCALTLLDTLIAHKDSCVGMAANMIGVSKRIIAFVDESSKLSRYTVMLNPVITERSGAYETEESCLSLLGGPRKCKRFKRIKVEYMSMDFKKHTQVYTDFTAQIIQHEMDHLEGILI